MDSAMIWILVAVVVYLLGMLAIGFKYANNSTSEDFYLGGRKLGPIVTAMSTEASDMSAYLLMGVPGLAFFCGVAEAGWTAIGLALGTYLNWLIVAKRLRRYKAYRDTRCAHGNNFLRSLHRLRLCCLRQAVQQPARV